MHSFTFLVIVFFSFDFISSMNQATSYFLVISCGFHCCLSFTLCTIDVHSLKDIKFLQKVSLCWKPRRQGGIFWIKFTSLIYIKQRRNNENFFPKWFALQLHFKHLLRDSSKDMIAHLAAENAFLVTLVNTLSKKRHVKTATGNFPKNSLSISCFHFHFLSSPVWLFLESRLTKHGVYPVTHNLSFFKLFCRAQPIKLGWSWYFGGFFRTLIGRGKNLNSFLRRS